MIILKIKIKIYLIKKQVFAFLPMKVCQHFSEGLIFLLMDNCFYFQLVFGKRILSRSSNTAHYFIERIS